MASPFRNRPFLNLSRQTLKMESPLPRMDNDTLCLPRMEL